MENKGQPVREREDRIGREREGQRKGNPPCRGDFKSCDVSEVRRKGRNSILETGELFQDSPLNEFYGLQEEESSSVFLLNGQSPSLVPSLKAVFDSKSRPTAPQISFFNDPFRALEGEISLSSSPLRNSTKLVPILHSPGNSRLRGVRKLRKSEDLLPAISPTRPILLQHSGFPQDRENSPKRPILRKPTMRPLGSIVRPQALIADAEQKELEASIQQLNQLLSQVRKQPFGFLPTHLP